MDTKDKREVEEIKKEQYMLEKRLQQLNSKEIDRYLEKVDMLRDYFEKIGGHTDKEMYKYLEALPMQLQDEYVEKVIDAWRPLWLSVEVFGDVVRRGIFRKLWNEEKFRT